MLRTSTVSEEMTPVQVSPIWYLTFSPPRNRHSHNIPSNLCPNTKATMQKTRQGSPTLTRMHSRSLNKSINNIARHDKALSLDYLAFLVCDTTSKLSSAASLRQLYILLANNNNLRVRIGSVCLLAPAFHPDFLAHRHEVCSRRRAVHDKQVQKKGKRGQKYRTNKRRTRRNKSPEQCNATEKEG